jgi:hypothetical protein
MGAAAAAATAAWRLGHASASSPPRAKRLLVINLSGGIRSSAAFHAAPSNAASALEHNPWGTIASPAASALSLGQLLDDHLRTDAPGGTSVLTGAPTAPLADAAYQTDPAGGWKGVVLPRLRESAGFSVLGTWHEGRGDHTRSSFEEPTGAPDGSQSGILTRAMAGLAQNGDVPVPAFHVAPLAQFGRADGAVVRHAPVTLDSPYSLPGAAVLDQQQLAAIGHDWAADDAMRDRLDEERLAGRVGFARDLLAGFSAHRRTNRAIGARLAEPWVHVEQPSASATFGSVVLSSGDVPLSNAMLFELAQLAGGAANAYGESYFAAALDWMLAVRLLQLGSRAVTVEMGGWDLHSGEASEAPALYATFGRLWATLGWLLARMPDPDGDGTMLDHTLVMTMSDFGRDRGTVGGFNGGEGSDHGVDPSCFYLAHGVMGAGVPTNRLLGAAPLDTFDPRGQGPSFGPRDVLATLLFALGLDHRDPVWGFDDVAEPIPLWG